MQDDTDRVLLRTTHPRTGAGEENSKAPSPPSELPAPLADGDAPSLGSVLPRLMPLATDDGDVKEESLTVATQVPTTPPTTKRSRTDDKDSGAVRSRRRKTRRFPKTMRDCQRTTTLVS